MSYTQVSGVGLAPIEREFLSLAERIETERLRGDDLVQCMGTAPIPDRPQAVDGKGRSDWVVYPQDQDPHLSSGRFAIPKPQQRHLRQIERRGVRFDRLFIAHEVPAGSARQLIRNGRFDHAAASRAIGEPTRDPRIQHIAERIDDLATGVGNGVAAGVVGVGFLALSPVLLLGAMVGAAGLDPCVIGAVTASGRAYPGEPAAYFHLVSWR